MITPEEEERISANLLPNNEGTLDRVLRVLIGLALLSVTVVGPKTAWGWVG